MRHFSVCRIHNHDRNIEQISRKLNVWSPEEAQLFYVFEGWRSRIDVESLTGTDNKISSPYREIIIEACYIVQILNSDTLVKLMAVYKACFTLLHAVTT